jgi:putative glycosyltransferase (TIGR04372 family)
MLSSGAADGDALHLAGVAKFQSGDAGGALELLQRAVAVAPANIDARVDLATVLTDVDRLVEAISQLREALDLRPDHGIAHYNLANVLLRFDWVEEARQHYTRAVELLPQDAKVVNNLGIALERLGKAEDARRHFDEALRLAPKFAEAHENIGRLLIQRDELEEGMEWLEKALSLQPRLHHLRFELFVWYDRLGRYERMAALAAMPKTPAPQRCAGKHDVERVFGCILQLVTNDLERRKGRVRIDDRLMIFAARLMELGHPSKLWMLEEIARLNPDNLHAYVHLGVAYYHDCRYQEAERAWATGYERRQKLAEHAGIARQVRLLDASWYQAVGHIALLDTYIKAQKLGWIEEKDLYLLRVPGQKVPNQTYLNYWRRHVHMPEPNEYGSNLPAVANEIGVPQERFPCVTDHLWATRLARGKTLWHMKFAAAVQREWEARNGEPLLALRQQDQKAGQDTLAQVGVPRDAWFVCFHVREPGFWWNWNRFHASTRDADIDSYIDAMQAVVARGGWVIRMGDPSMKKLPPMKGVIDYAHSTLKSEAMDVYLSAACRFFVGVNSGLSLLPSTFGRPTVLTNFTPLSVPFPYSTSILLPKLFRRRDQQRYLSIEEMFSNGLADAQFAKRVPPEIEVVDNAPDDIRDAVLEMLDELEDKLGEVELAEVQKLRLRYDTIALKHDGFLGNRLGGRFLLRYRDLL